MSQQENETQLTYAVYETTNTITGQTYVGVFSYDGLTAKGTYKFDKYIGQGITHDCQAEKMKPTQFVKNVIEYGFNNFTRKILLTTHDEEVAYTVEASIANETYVNNPMTLNQRQGGRYGKLGKASRHRKSIASKGGKNPAAKKVMCTSTGKIFTTIKEASEKLCISYNILKYQLSNNNTTNITLV